MTSPRADFDTPWKEVLELYFEPCLQFFFPAAHAQIDWSRPYEFLDKELQQVVRDAQLGRRYADKLVRVWLLDGQDLWILIHSAARRGTRFSPKRYLARTTCRRLGPKVLQPVNSYEENASGVDRPDEVYREARRPEETSATSCSGSMANIGGSPSACTIIELMQRTLSEAA